VSVLHRIVGLRPPRIAMTLVAAAAALHVSLPIAAWRSFPLAAVLVATAGFAIMLRAWWLFRRAATPVCPTDDAAVLITDDVFAFTRNPMYLGIVMMVFAVALGVGSAPFYAAGLLLFAILNGTFCPYEERRLAAAFRHYAAYAARVPRWI